MYFIEDIEVETGTTKVYEQMLADLVEDVGIRIDSGRW